MSLTEYHITDVHITLAEQTDVDSITIDTPDVLVISAANVGPRGPQGKWEALTQFEYDLLNPPDPDTLYVIIQ